MLGMHSWPGNVRELENVIGHACMMVIGDLIDVQDLPSYLHSPAGAPGTSEATPEAGVATLEDQERRRIIRLSKRRAGTNRKLPASCASAAMPCAIS